MPKLPHVSGEIKAGGVYRVYRIIIPHVKVYWKWFLLAYLALFAGVIMNLLKPWPIKLIIDHILLDKPMPQPVLLLSSLAGHDKLFLLAVLCIGIVVIFFLEGLFGFIRKYFMGGAGENTINDIRQEVFGHLQMRRRGAERSGDLVVRLTSDINSMRQLVTHHIQALVSFFFTFTGIIVIMFLMDRQLTLLALLVVPPLYLMALHFSARIKALARIRREKESAVAAIVEETMTSTEVVKAFAREEEEQSRFNREADESLEAALGSMRLSKGFSRAVQVVIAVGTALVVYFGARRALAGYLTPGDLIVFTAYLRDLYKPVGSLTDLILNFTRDMVCGERIADILESEITVSDAPDAVEAPHFRGEVVFDAVTFAYEPGVPVLQDLSFTARPGQMVALIGSSGTGKSTIVNLLLRFHDPGEGRILIDGQDIRSYTSKSLREQISVVLQEPLLFRRTVRENIAYGKPGASIEEIVEAAQAAQAHEFIMGLANGYDTFLSERGANLSGGQRQRIALARAILKNAPIFILDEPVTGLDAATEARLNETLNRLIRGKTSFIVAHRFATIMKADLILMVEEGRIAEQGTHEQLLAKSDRYRTLYELQRI